MDVDGIPKEGFSLLLLLLIIIVFLEFKAVQEGLFKGLEEFDIEDEDCITGIVLHGILITDVHVLQDINSSRTQWLIHIEMNLSQLIWFILITSILLLR